VTEAWWDSSVEAQVISRCHRQTAVGAVKAVIVRGTNSLIDN
jgi:SNF2 family DNA or RNA helicase